MSKIALLYGQSVKPTLSDINTS